jgi:hypothetical protein
MTRSSRSRATRTVNAEAEKLKGDLPERVAKADEQGYWGSVPDPTPNEAYTLAGVIEGQPTPETDAKLRAAAEARSEELSDGLNPNANAPADND